MVVTSVNLMCVWWLLEHWFLHPCLNYYLRCLNYCAYDVCLNCFYGYRSIIRISSLNHSSLSWLITLLQVQLCAWYNFSFFPTPPPPFLLPMNLKYLKVSRLIISYLCKAWEGVGVVASARKLIGSTDPLQADPGTIRGDLAVQTGRLEALVFGAWLV